VHGLLIIALGRADVVLPGQQEVVRIAEPWRPYRSLATAYLFQTAFDVQPGTQPTGTQPA